MNANAPTLPGNPSSRMPDNVEKSVFHEGYVAWDGMGQPWRIARSHRNKSLWEARPAPNHKSRWLPPVQASTLREVAATLAARAYTQRAGEPF